MHRGFHDQARARETHLAGVVELVHRLPHDRVEVGVGERHERRLAAELERDRREVRTGRLRDELAGRDADPVNAMRSTPGCAVRAAPASSPMPCSTLNAPSGSPAPCAMSASIEAVSGAHSGGFSTTALPAARAGATRQVASIRGAFQGVMTTVTPLGSQATRSAKPSYLLHAGLERQQLVGEEPEVAGDPRHHGVPHRPQQRTVVARLDGGEFGHPRLDAVGDAMQHVGAFLRRHRAPGRASLARRGYGSVGLVDPAAGDVGDGLLVDRRDIGERGVRRHAVAPDPVIGRDLDALDDGAARRAPLPRVQRTSTGRSGPNGMGAAREGCQSRRRGAGNPCDRPGASEGDRTRRSERGSPWHAPVIRSVVRVLSSPPRAPRS